MLRRSAREAGRSHIAFTVVSLEASTRGLRHSAVSRAAYADYVADGKLQTRYLLRPRPGGKRDRDSWKPSGRYRTGGNAMSSTLSPGQETASRQIPPTASRPMPRITLIEDVYAAELTSDLPKNWLYFCHASRSARGRRLRDRRDRRAVDLCDPRARWLHPWASSTSASTVPISC